MQALHAHSATELRLGLPEEQMRFAHQGSVECWNAEAELPCLPPCAADPLCLVQLPASLSVWHHAQSSAVVPAVQAFLKSIDANIQFGQGLPLALCCHLQPQTLEQNVWLASLESLVWSRLQEAPGQASAIWMQASRAGP